METVRSVAVVIASLGRPENVRMLLDRLALQTLMPSQVVLSMEGPQDCPDLDGLPFEVNTVFGPRGMTVQRNRGLDLLAGADAFVFFDDDYVPSRFAIEGIARGFNAFPDAGGLTGRLLADGIKGPGISPAEAAEAVDKEDARCSETPPAILNQKPLPGLYGCNMAYRTVSAGSERFDEDLPLYGWQEDNDFATRIKGRLLKTDAFYGVHCGEKRGREKSGLRLGYSQMVNPVYLIRKGTMRPRFALNLIMRNFLANHAKMATPEPWIDRRGRAAGNWRAIWDILRGRADPRRILEF